MPMEIVVNSFLLVFAGEMGDKTQLLALVLAARFGAPWRILAGVLVATLLNHALAAWAGAWISGLFAAETVRWILAAVFFACAAWILIPDKEDSAAKHPAFGPFLTTLVVFFLAEMGDKTQIATVALGARYSDLTLVTAGTTLGMLASNALAVFLGDRLLKRLPMKWIRIATSALFALSGLGLLLA